MKTDSQAQSQSTYSELFSLRSAWNNLKQGTTGTVTCFKLKQRVKQEQVDSCLKCARSNSMFLRVLLFLPSTAAFLAQGFSTFFSAPCPAGWSEIPSARGRVVVSVIDASVAGLTVGAALGPEEDRLHNHSFSGTFTLPSKHIAAPSGGDDKVGAESGAAFPFSGTTAGAESGLPFVQFYLCRLLADSPDLALPFGGVGYFSPEVPACPANHSAYAAAAGRAIVPGYIATGGAPFPVSGPLFELARPAARPRSYRLRPPSYSSSPLPHTASPLTPRWPPRRTARTRTRFQPP